MAAAWLDNLIPLRARLDEWQLAGWQPTRVAEAGLGCRLIADVMIPMTDGVHLSADVYTPRRPGRYPVIVTFSAYNRDFDTIGMPLGTNEIGSPSIIADRGYVQVVVTARGVGRSEGTLQPWQCKGEVDDHQRCVEWASEQPWSNGSVCLFGTSYYGMSQPAVAARRLPMLKAFFCNEICTDFRRHLYRYGGVFNADFISLWTGANFNPSAMRRRVAPVLRALLSQIVNRPWSWRLIHARLDKIMEGFKTNQLAPEALRYVTAALADDDEGLPQPLGGGAYRDLPNIEIPFVVAQNRGMISLHQFGAYDLFEHAGTPRHQRHLIIGPGEYVLPVYSWQLEALAFFDHVLKGVDNGYDKLARVRYWRDGAGTWGEADDIPPSDASRRRLHLQAGGELAAEAPADGACHWLSVPRGTPVVPGIAPQELSFAYNVTEPLELLGPVTLNLRFSCNEIDSYLVARLDCIDRDGHTRLLAMGHLRPSRRRVDEASSSKNEIAIDSHAIEPLTPNTPLSLRFSLTPAAATIKPGETLRLRIASRTDLFRPLPSEGFIAPDMAVPPYYARNTIHFGIDSALDLTLRDAVPT